jgi:hypothetical protein
MIPRAILIATLGMTTTGTTSANAADLSTGYGAGVAGSQATMMFDIVVGGQDIVLTQVGANMQADLGAAVYVRTGTHVGNEFSGAGWVEIYNNPTVLGNGNGVETVLDVNDTNLSASQTYGIAIVVPDRQEAGAGTVLGAVAAPNADLSILEGQLTNANYPDAFVGNFQLDPFVVETTLYYDIAAQAVPLSGKLMSLLAASLLVISLWGLRRLHS